MKKGSDGRVRRADAWVLSWMAHLRPATFPMPLLACGELVYSLVFKIFFATNLPAASAFVVDHVASLWDGPVQRAQLAYWRDRMFHRYRFPACGWSGRKPTSVTGNKSRLNCDAAHFSSAEERNARFEGPGQHVPPTGS